MRVLFTTQPAEGHLNPMLGLSAALRRAGHEVVFATSASFVPRVESRGERAIAAGLDWLESDGPVEPPDPQTDPTGLRTIFPRLFLREVARAMTDDLLEVVADLRPDVLVRESVEFAGAAVAERFGLPWVTFELTFPIDFHIMTTTGDLEDGSELEDLRAHADLPPAADPDWFLGDLQISTLPERYRSRYPLRPGQVLTQPHTHHLVDDESPGWVGDLDGAVYVTLGTVFPSMFPHVLEIAATGAARLDRAVVVTCGPSVHPDALELPDAPHVRGLGYAPQGPVLDRCVAAVTHGGAGTTLGALSRGVPLVVVPLGADQFGHANAVDRLGAGVVLDHSELTAGAVEAGLRTVIDDPSYRDAAAAVAQGFADLPPPDAVVPDLEALVSG